jgi:hypothetical protein
MGKDGTPGIVRQEERERLEAAERAATSGRHTVIYIQGGGRSPGNNPFSNMSFSINNLPAGMVTALPAILSQGMREVGPPEGQEGRPRSIGERQARASSLAMRVSEIVQSVIEENAAALSSRPSRPSISLREERQRERDERAEEREARRARYAREEREREPM